MRPALRTTSALLVLLLLGAANAAPGEDPEKRFSEPGLQAAYLRIFASFTSWPDGTFVDRDVPLIIGVFGSEDVADALEGLIRNSPVKDHPRVVKRLKKAEEAANCHVVFVTKGQDTRAILAAAQCGGVLTVGEAGDFAKEGGMIQLVRVGENLRFDISLAAAEKAGLSISSKVLKSARKVLGEPKPGGNEK